MSRLRFDGVRGTTSAILLAGDTDLSSPGLERMGDVNSGDTAAICLASADSHGNITTIEIVWVTAHVAGAVTATILRAQEGTTAIEWANGSQWAHGLDVADVATFAPLDSPPLTGTPTAPTPTTAADRQRDPAARVARGRPRPPPKP